MGIRLSKTVSLLLLTLLVTSAITIAAGASVNTASSLTVSVSSPASGTVFNRGQGVTITASVSSGGSPVSGASVVANSPAGATIVLSQTSTPGTYSAHYTVLATDPVGAWIIVVQAVKNGQVGSAQAMVQVSDLILTTVLSPAQNSKFNIGEGVTVKATVTLLDGSPLPPSASVTFSTPTGGSVSMSVDPSDSSGRTWVGAYTVLASDVPADGVIWHLTLTATFDGNTGPAALNIILYRTLTVDVTTFSSSTFTVPQDAFAKGETVYVKGVVDLQDGSVVSSGSVTFVISGASVAATPVSMVFTPSLSAWTGSYTLLASDQAGSQVVTVSATDLHGNAGSGVHQITVGTSSGLVVSMTSPSPNSVFNRGETATISALVTMGGAPVTGATVTATTPVGGTIALTPGTGGTYSAQYTVSSTDPVGVWSITVAANLGTQSGSAQVTSMISASLKLSVIAPPPGTQLNIGQSVTVKATVTFQDGSAIPASASISFRGPAAEAVTMSVNPSDPSHVTWVGAYTITAADVPVDGTTWYLTVSASVGGNTGSSGATAVKLFNSLNVQVSTWSSSSFTTPKDSFVRGDTIYVEAQVLYHDGTVVSSGTVNFEITGTSIAGTPVAMAFSSSLHAWVGSYTLLQTDSTGSQIVSVSALDPSGNRGSGTHTIGIEVPVTSLQPLEAKITFNPQTHDLAVEAVCNTGCVSPTTVSFTSTANTAHHDHGGGDDDRDDGHGDGTLRTYTLSDSAGHTLVLEILVFAEGQGVKAQLVSIQYGNSAPISVPDNEISFGASHGGEGNHDWKDGGHGNLQQSISINDVVSARAHFDAKNDVTHIQIETQNRSDNNEAGQNLKLNGFWLLDLVTSNGSLSVDYFQAA